MSQAHPRLVGITQGKHQPSTRFRWAQYAPGLQQAGFAVTELESRFGAYAPISRVRRPAWLAASVAENLLRAVRANGYDLRFLQRNLTATLCTYEPMLKRPFIFDVDDAIFLGARGGNANRIAKAASLVVCGNNFLADHFSNYGPVAVLPTAVDSALFSPPKNGSSFADRQVIGWSGSSSGFKYIYAIEPSINQVLMRHPDAIFKVISDQEPTFTLLPTGRVVFEKWSASREVAVLHDFSVGIMPLDDDLWARGKCSFKMLTYMAVGLPVVVSPVGMNVEILHQGSCGFAATTADDWVEAISSLLSNTTLADQMGRTGRQIVEARYAMNVITPKLVQLLRSQL